MDAWVKPAHDGGSEAVNTGLEDDQGHQTQCLGGHRLHATFSDGTSGEHDFSALVAKAGPMGEPLRDPAYFARVFLEAGAPTWPNGLDMCPDWLRREIGAIGERDQGTPFFPKTS